MVVCDRPAYRAVPEATGAAMAHYHVAPEICQEPQPPRSLANIRAIIWQNVAKIAPQN